MGPKNGAGEAQVVPTMETLISLKNWVRSPTPRCPFISW